MTSSNFILDHFAVTSHTYNKTITLMIPQNVSDIIDTLHGDLDSFTCPEIDNKKVFLN